MEHSGMDRKAWAARVDPWTQDKVRVQVSEIFVDMA